MAKNFFQNTFKPEGFLGKVVVTMMNSGHAKMADWGFSHLDLQRDSHVLDIGCGGGANIAFMLKKCVKGKVYGVDYSEVSVEKSKKINMEAVQSGKCEIRCASVLELPFDEAAFDVITAFETVYSWPGLDKAFEQVYKVLKNDGIFMICNEVNGLNASDEKWTKIIDGMVIYTEKQLRNYLEGAGFKEIQAHTNDKNWLCLIAKK